MMGKERQAKLKKEVQQEQMQRLTFSSQTHRNSYQLGKRKPDHAISKRVLVDYKEISS